MVVEILSSRLDHIKYLRGAGYDFVCSRCKFVYKTEPPKGCNECGGSSFSRIESVIHSLELRLN